MDDKKKLCMSCMSAVPDHATCCPNCGFDGTQKNEPDLLPIGTRLNGRFVVGKKLETDGISVTYYGYDMEEGNTVWIREFFPTGGCSRDPEGFVLIPKQGAEQHYKSELADFRRLYSGLVSLNDCAGLVSVRTFFECNFTAYAVIEPFESIPLRELLRIKNAPISWDQSMLLFAPILDAVERMHRAGLLHCGIGPDTILINRNGDVKLFGYAVPSVRKRGSESGAKLYSGYSAPEQYASTGQPSAATDIYALAATIYRTVTGVNPQGAEKRRAYDSLQPAGELMSGIPSRSSKALMLAMLLNEEERLSDIELFRRQLCDENLVELPKEETEGPQEDSVPMEPLTAEQKKYRLTKTVFYSSIAMFAFSLLFLCIWLAVSASVRPTEIEPVQTEQADEIKVPNYIGQNIEDDHFDTSAFLVVIEPIYVAGSEEGEVVRQDPAPESAVKYGSTLTLYVHHVRWVENLPDFTGLTRENAELYLKEIGIEHYSFEQRETDGSVYPNNTVLDQSTDPNRAFNASEDELVLYLSFVKKSTTEER